MEENIRKAVIEALEPNEAVSLVKQLVNIPESGRRRAGVRSLSL